MYGPDENHTAFLTNQGLYYYTVMPFGLKNVDATYQRLVNFMFADQLEETMEANIDNMLVKSRNANNHVTDLATTFEILKHLEWN